MKLRDIIGGRHSSRRNISIIVSLSVSMLFIFIGCGKKEEPVAEEIIRPVKTMTVAAGTDSAGLTLPGKVRAAQRVELAFKEVGGRLIELPIAGREGQEVKEGDLLARIDPKRSRHRSQTRSRQCHAGSHQIIKGGGGHRPQQIE
jgi:multidrug efflux pump subunit AcrA (membrane-fusion protein)